MPQGNLVEVLGCEVRKGSEGELMVESSPSRKRRPPCKTSKEMSDEAADAATLTYLLTTFHRIFGSCVLRPPRKNYFFAVPRRGSFGRILTMQLEPPKTSTTRSCGPQTG